MCGYKNRFMTALFGAGLPILAATIVHATTIDVTIDTSFLNGTAAVLAFDFIDGGAPDNTVTLSALTSDGTQGSPSTTGNVTGTGPWTFSDAGGGAFNELLVPFNPIGTTVSFSFSTTDHPSAGPVPDGFSMFVLDSSLATLIKTDDPTGSDALFVFGIGQGFAGATQYEPQETGFAVTLTPVGPLSEPGSLALALLGTLTLLARRGKI
jgi:hypothetical protein